MKLSHVLPIDQFQIEYFVVDQVQEVNYSSILSFFKNKNFPGTLNPEEDCKEAELYLRNQGGLSAPATLTYNPSKQQQSVTDQLKRDELARRFMYTSIQQAAFDEVPWGLFK